MKRALRIPAVISATSRNGRVRRVWLTRRFARRSFATIAADAVGLDLLKQSRLGGLAIGQRVLVLDIKNIEGKLTVHRIRRRKSR